MATHSHQARYGRYGAHFSVAPPAVAYAVALVSVTLGGTASFDTIAAHLPYVNASLLFFVASIAALAGGLEAARRFHRARRTLLRHVPGSVATRILRGDEAISGERDVSALFVDIRGYTSRVEKSTPEQVHDLIGRFTLAVSTIIDRHGGSVVEFGGDGVMAVFGAPDPLADKERASVQAARAIVDTVGGLVRTEGDSDAGGIEVGIGVASGPAFTGIIPAADRLFWSAVGNTVNLASRLQDLTRELNVPIAMDETTWKRMGNVDGAVVEPHFGVTLKGFTRGENVYTLSPIAAPLPVPATALPWVGGLVAEVGQAT